MQTKKKHIGYKNRLIDRTIKIITSIIGSNALFAVIKNVCEHFISNVQVVSMIALLKTLNSVNGNKVLWVKIIEGYEHTNW